VIAGRRRIYGSDASAEFELNHLCGSTFEGKVSHGPPPTVRYADAW